MSEMDKILNKPATTEGGAINKNSSGVFIPKQWLIYIAVAVALIAVVQFAPPFIAQIQTGVTSSSTTPQPPTDPQFNGQPPIGTATPSQDFGQEKDNNGWYQIGEQVKFNLQKYKKGLSASIALTNEGSINIVTSDFNALETDQYASDPKYLTVNVKFKIKGDNKIYQSGVIAVTKTNDVIKGDWKKILNKPVNQNDVLWQSEFGLQDKKPSSTSQGVMVK